MRNRSVIELMVLIFTLVVSLSLLATTVVVGITEINDPEIDTSNIVQVHVSLLSGILGALLGLIAGKATSSADSKLSTRPGEDKPSELNEPTHE